MAVEPFGPMQDDLRAGVVASFMAAAGGGKVMPADLFPSLAGPRAEVKAQAATDWKRVARSIARATGGGVVRRG